MYWNRSGRISCSKKDARGGIRRLENDTASVIKVRELRGNEELEERVRTHQFGHVTPSANSCTRERPRRRPSSA